MAASSGPTVDPGATGTARIGMVARCNWMIADGDAVDLCASCRLTSVRPNDSEADSLEAFADAEAAKRRLLHQLMGLGLPVIDRSVDEERGVAFELLSSRGQKVITGHEAGVITLDLSESDDVHREFVRQQLGEPYRTVLGHLRHEIGHYYWPAIVEQNGQLEAFRALFGDERVSYEDALEQHYAGGQDELGSHAREPVRHDAPMGGLGRDVRPLSPHRRRAGHRRRRSVWTVAEPALSAGARRMERHETHVSIGEMIQSWLGLSLALNAMSRSIGQSDLYPFVLSPEVVEKLDFVHCCIREATDA